MVQGIGLGLAQFHSGCRGWGRMVEEVPEEENYQEPQKAWQRIFKREWIPGMAKGPGGNTGTDMARVRLWNLGKKRGEVPLKGDDMEDRLISLLKLFNSYVDRESSNEISVMKIMKKVV